MIVLIIIYVTFVFLNRWLNKKSYELYGNKIRVMRWFTFVVGTVYFIMYLEEEGFFLNGMIKSSKFTGGNWKNPKHAHEAEKIYKQVRPGHITPRGFTNTNKCENCSAVGGEWDLRDCDPCPYCGGKVVFNGIGRWANKKWVKR